MPRWWRARGGASAGSPGGLGWASLLGERRTPRGAGCPARPLGALITKSEQRNLAARLWSGVETCWHVLEGALGRAQVPAHDTEPGLLNDSDFSESGAWWSVQGTGLLPRWEGGDPLAAVAPHGPPLGPDHLPTASPGVRASRKGFQGRGQPVRGSPLTRNRGRRDRKRPRGSSPQSRCLVSPRRTPQVTAHGPGRSVTACGREPEAGRAVGAPRGRGLGPGGRLGARARRWPRGADGPPGGSRAGRGRGAGAGGHCRGRWFLGLLAAPPRPLGPHCRSGPSSAAVLPASSAVLSSSSPPQRPHRGSLSSGLTA